MLACTVVLFLARSFGTSNIGVMLAIIPICCIVFLLAMLIGFFLSAPLRTLNKKIKAYRSGNTQVDFSCDGTLFEADCLAEDFHDLLTSSAAQTASLSQREQRQMHFISDVAHELRTPLTAIRGNAEILQDPDLPDDMRIKFSQTIIDESERLTHLANDLLSLQHIEHDDAKLDLQRLNLKPLAEEVVTTMQPIFDARDAHVEITNEAPDVLGNPDKLKQVITNLLDNASRHIDPGGHITVELYGIHGKSVMAVKDDGCGFGDVDPRLLFQRFYRTDSSRQRGTGGNGLGLSIVQGIVEAHDGTVEAVNLPEGGACFIVALPALPVE